MEQPKTWATDNTDITAHSGATDNTDNTDHAVLLILAIRVVGVIRGPLRPLGQHFGIHPVHLASSFVANLELGYLTPPVGMNLFLASYRFKKPLLDVTAAALPMLAFWHSVSC